MTDKRHRSQADDRPKPEPDVVPGSIGGGSHKDDRVSREEREARVADERARRARMPSDDDQQRRSRVSKTDPEDDRRE